MTALSTLPPILPELSQNIWERYGFRGNPFDTRALSASAESTLPIAQAIVGRGMESPESQLLTNFLRNPGGGRMDAVNTVVSNLPQALAQTLDMDAARAFLARLVFERIRLQLTKREWEVLRTAVRLDAFTNTDVTTALGHRRQNVTKYLNTLLDKNFIHPYRRDGRRILYRVSEDVRIVRDVPENEQISLFGYG
jgi:DNA-binding MarR family transcriptional regulator